jgi:hypothetical protein
MRSVWLGECVDEECVGVSANKQACEREQSERKCVARYTNTHLQGIYGCMHEHTKTERDKQALTHTLTHSHTLTLTHTIIPFHTDTHTITQIRD